MSITSGIAAGPYSFPVSKLRIRTPSPEHPSCEHSCRQHGGTVLVACGSFNPPTTMHLRMFELAAAELETKGGCAVLGAYMSPVGDAYGKAGLAAGAHRLAMCEAASASSPLVMVDSWEVMQPGYTRTLLVLRHVREEIKRHWQGEQPRVLLLCGADVLASMAVPGVWKEPEVLLEEFGVVCLTRGGTDLGQLLSSSGQQQRQGQAQRGSGGEGPPGVPGGRGVGEAEGAPAGCSEAGQAEQEQHTSEQEGLGQMFSKFRSHITLVQLPDEDMAAGTHTLSSSMVRSRLQAGDPIEGLVHPGVERYIREQGLYI